MIGKSWKSELITINSEGKYVSSIEGPNKGWRAYFLEAQYNTSSSIPFVVTSEVKVSPDILPFKYIDPINPKGFLSKNLE